MAAVRVMNAGPSAARYRLGPAGERVLVRRDVEQVSDYRNRQDFPLECPRGAGDLCVRAAAPLLSLLLPGLTLALAPALSAVPHS